MLTVFISIALLVAAVIHLMPVMGILGAEKLRSLYGVNFNDPNSLILMQHRAVLFGLLGSLLVVAIFRVEYRWIAVIGGLISTVAFLLIAAINGNYNSSLKTVVIADIVAIVALLIAGVLMLVSQK